LVFLIKKRLRMFENRVVRRIQRPKKDGENYIIRSLSIYR